jgi:hypothetical protein
MDQMLQALCGVSRLLAARDTPILLELHAGLVDLAMGASRAPACAHARMACAMTWQAFRPP